MSTSDKNVKDLLMIASPSEATDIATLIEEYVPAGPDCCTIRLAEKHWLKKNVKKRFFISLLSDKNNKKKPALLAS